MNLRKYNHFYFSNSVGAYTSAFNAVVVSRGGSLTASELSYLTTFENSVGADMAEFDRLWIHGLSNQIAAKTSFVNPSSTAITEVNSPTWTANQGYTGNGSTSYLNPNYNFTTSSIKYTQDSASIFSYSRTNTASDFMVDFGCYSIGPFKLTQLNPRGLTGPNQIVGDINGLSNTIDTNTDSKGCYFLQRTNSASSSIYKNGSLIKTGTAASGLPNIDLLILCSNQNGVPGSFSIRQIAAIGWGSGAINQSNFYNAVQALGTSIGWAV